ncbi:MAG: restriction endonuclease subunit S, partial [Paludibacteraceae bacterium]|nr:restriction endonuclease subunit S [Paludibacteraceae bacterium]
MSWSFTWFSSHYEKFSDGTVKCIDDEIPFEIPESWEWIRLGCIIDFSKSSSVKSSEIKEDAWILDLEDIEKDTGVLLSKKRMRDVKSKSDKHLFHAGEVLYSKLRPYLNKVIIADENGYCTTEILCFDFQLIYNEYAQLYLMSPFFVEYAMSDAYGVKMPRLGSKKGNNALMPIPPIEEQNRIVDQYKKLKPTIKKYGFAQQELDFLNAEIKEKLKKSILQEAIQGNLVPQDFNDEPASVLLQRIKEEKLRLVKEGKLKKKDVVESVIYKGDDNRYYEKISDEVVDITEEIPFDVPEGWSWCRLKSICTIFTGAT